MVNSMKSTVIQIDPDIQSGEPVFFGTRVPIKSLFDYLGTGETLETYLEDFPAVTKEQALVVIEQSGYLLIQAYHVINAENIAG
ncbi:DUF433 domain-containing protein [Runella aurantiaca]|uniref:DUF433 domain-containing protein n=2 Tax=Runella aurantiaca TaxID=2282308 RepID=A0A369I7B7_9BACT|nr:DUF433 domain-containing protein [Runella aurantiaca]